MARRYRLEYLRKKRAKECQQELRRRKREELRAQKKNNKPAKEEKKEREDSPTSIQREILSWLLYIVAIVGITYLIVTYVGQRTEVSGNSMYPTLHNEDNLIVDKISYRFTKPKRFDIIVFPYQYQEDTYYIKRIIGMPGETIQIKEDGKVYINDEELKGDYGNEPIDIDKRGLAANPIQLKADEYFVMGDNRNHSSDSRDPSVGILHKSDFIGRAWIRIWPFKRIGAISHG